MLDIVARGAQGDTRVFQMVAMVVTHVVEIRICGSGKQTAAVVTEDHGETQRLRLHVSAPRTETCRENGFDCFCIIVRR